MPDISVIIPVYKAEKTLQKCVDSLRAQSMTDFEAILVDDGSPDNCPSLIDQICRNDMRFRAVHQENQGQSAARLAGLREARGAFISFLDSDDAYAEDALESMLAAAKNADMVLFGVREIFPDGRAEIYPQNVAPGDYTRARLEAELYPRMLYDGSYYRFGVLPSLCNKLFRRELLEKWLPPVPRDIRMGEDGACAYPCLLSASRVSVLNAPLYLYTQTEGSISRRGDQKALERLNLLVSYLLSTFRELAFDSGDQVCMYAAMMTVQALDSISRDDTLKGVLKKTRSALRALKSGPLIPLLRRVKLSALPKREACFILLSRRYLTLPIFLWLGRK